jgi:hypothetical protein
MTTTRRSMAAMAGTGSGLGFVEKGLEDVEAVRFAG